MLRAKVLALQKLLKLWVIWQREAATEVIRRSTGRGRKVGAAPPPPPLPAPSRAAHVTAGKNAKTMRIRSTSQRETYCCC